MLPKVEDRSVRRLVFLATGWLCVALGIAGLFVPGLPTTEFILALGGHLNPATDRHLKTGHHR